LLKKDNKEVIALFKKIEKTNEALVDQRKKFVDELKLELTHHAESEEKFFKKIRNLASICT